MRVAINGFGRIGRAVFKICVERGVNVVAINDLQESKTLSYLLKYDSVYGRYKKEVNYGKDYLRIDNKKINLFRVAEPGKLPWRRLKIDVVVESTGLFTERREALRHINAGAKKVLISAPAKNSDITVVP